MGTSKEVSSMEEVTGKLRYEKDSRRFNRFQVETTVGIVGVVYIPKGDELPKKVILDVVKE